MSTKSTGGKTTPAEPGEVLDPKQKPLVPKDAATLVILDRSQSDVRVLMGKRRADLAFMAGKYVFPGGRVDPEDRAVPVAADLRQTETAKLMVQMRPKPSAIRAKSLALAAVREAFEEAGVVIGAKASATVPPPTPSWSGFFGRGYQPTLAPLTFFARAITPPGRPRRFDTRFFCMDASAIVERLGHNDGELSGVDWVTLAGARELDLPNITRLVLEDLQEQIEAGTLAEGTNPVPFYYAKNGSFKRELIRAPG